MIPEPVMTFLNEAAQSARTSLSGADSSLFLAGVLDSFSLVEFVTVVESNCGIRVNDRDLRPENFDTLTKIDAFIQSAQERK